MSKSDLFPPPPGKKLKKTASAFRPRARLLRQLGEELIGDNIVAVVELAKNAFDADASYLKVRIHSKEGWIEVTDDGHGMDIETVRTTWMEPGTPNKKNRTTSPMGRPLLGNKGIGRFATDKLARKLMISSKTNGSRRFAVGEFNWSDFDRSTKYLDDVKSETYEVETTEHSRHGTTLFLSDLRQDWTANDAEKLRVELLKLVSPFASSFPGEFRIELSFDGEDQDLGSLSHAMLSRATCCISASYFPSQHGDLEISINGEKRILQKTLFDFFSDAGPISAQIYIWKRSHENLSSIGEELSLSSNEVKRMLDQWSGISIYRDGFRVYPYGQPGNDWLGLDKRRIYSPKFNLSNNQIIGAIHISETQNPNLIDQTNRTGLIHNSGFESLKDVIGRVIREAGNYLLEQDNRRAPTKRSKGSSRLINSDALERIVKDLEFRLDAPSRENLLALSRQAVEETKESEKRVFEEISRYRRLLSLGVVASRMAHEVRQQTELLRRSGRILGKRLEKLGVSDKRVSDKLKAIDCAGGVIDREVRRISPFMRSRRSLQIVSIRTLLLDLVEQTERARRGTGISILIDEESLSQISVRVDYGEIFQVFNNLLENSFYWLKSSKEKLVKISGKVEGSFCTIFVEDTGPGIEPFHSDLVFLPFWTQKESGGGLGLPIAGEILHDYGGSIRLLKSQHSKGATFAIRLPIPEGRSG